MRDRIGIEVTPERIDTLRQHVHWQSDPASREAGLMLDALQAEVERLQRRLRIVEQAVNWTVVEMERDCQPGSIGAAWLERLTDARRRADAVRPEVPDTDACG